MYEYKCKVERVVDGDTVDISIDLGFDISVKQRVRLLNINAPESRTRDLEEKKRGIAATEYLKALFVNASSVKVQTELDARGKYGRVLGTFFWRTHDSHEWSNVNEKLVLEGHAVFKEY